MLHLQLPEKREKTVKSNHVTPDLKERDDVYAIKDVDLSSSKAIGLECRIEQLKQVKKDDNLETKNLALTAKVKKEELITMYFNLSSKIIVSPGSQSPSILKSRTSVSMPSLN